MSTLAYAQITTARIAAPPRPAAAARGAAPPPAPPGVGTFVDALSALVPAEVLTLHALALTATTKVTNGVTEITAKETLGWAFAALLVMAALLFAVPRALQGTWTRLDWLRTAIPPLAFLGWTMLQRATAFDAVFPDFNTAPRTVIGVFLGVVLGLVAGLLAKAADKSPPPAGGA